MSGSWVTAYEEKPEDRVLVSSGVSVLGPDALALLPGDRPSGLVNLFHALAASGHRVRGHVHAAPWIDVNDSAAVARAEALVRANPESFAP
jgi:NDP-sugar pyrophosphorylase family protein